MKRILTLIFVVCIVAGFCFAQGSTENAVYPSREIEVIIPVNPGGGTDSSCRIMLPELEKELGVALVPVNISGASGSVGMDEVIESDPDGYTVLYQQSDMIALSCSGVVDYNWYDEFKVACIANSIYNMALVVAADAPYDDVSGLIEYAKSQSKPLSIATETGTDNHLFMMEFANQAGIELNYVDLGGAGSRVAAMKGRQIDMTCMPYANIKSYIDSGDVKCIGIFSEERDAFYPDVPTMKEQGLNVVYSKFHIFSFPKDTPDDVVARFSEAVRNVCANEQIVSELGSKLGFTVTYMDSADAYDFMMEIDSVYRPLGAKLAK